MKRRLTTNSLLILTLTFVTVLFSGCNDSDCPKVVVARIEEIIIPDTVKRDDQVEILVKASIGVVCFKDLYVELAELEQFKYSIQAYATTTCCEDLCVCPSAVEFLDTVILFQPIDKGLYRFHITTSQIFDKIDSMVVL